MATATAPGYRTSYTVKARSRAGEHEGDMEGTTHAATGLLLGAGIGLLTTGPLRGTGTVHDLAVAHAVGRDLLFGAMTAGMALLPDADHPDATFAYSAGAVSHGISHVIAVLFGGHRQGMHSLFGIAFWSAAAEACAVWWPNRWALGFLAAFLAICIVAGLKATGFMRHGGRGHRYHGGALRRALVGCGIAALAVTYARADLWWLVALGMALHILEDEFSGHGCALLWPFTRRRFGGDGHQPAARRSSPGRRPKSEFQKAKARAARASRGPVAPKAPSRPAARGLQSMCLRCMVGECDACKGQGCKCPQPATSHLNRTGTRRKPAERPELPDTPPY
jgi:membrane-bound metal-dependent hydrolase YbcI (DUF457 family)